MIPPRYTLFPSAVLRRSEIPIHLRWTYLVLYALAWNHQYEWLSETYNELAGTFTALEGQTIAPGGIRRRLERLAEFGLIERRRIHSQEWRTYLLVRHDSLGATASDTQEAVGATVEGHPISNRAVVVEEELSQSKEQQHLLQNMGVTDESRRLLEAMGVLPRKAKALAQLPHVTPEYLERIAQYQADTVARGGKALGPGWVVVTVDAGEEPPSQEPDRYRYIQGRYKDFVRH